MISHKAVQRSRSALIDELLIRVYVEIRATSEENVEEGCNRRDDVCAQGLKSVVVSAIVGTSPLTNTNIDVDKPHLPGFDDDTREEDAQRYLQHHHCNNVGCLANHHPLNMSVIFVARV